MTKKARWFKKIEQINDTIALKVTLIFGTMWMTYLFFLYGLTPLFFPQYMSQLLYWSNTVQLWSLPLLMVGTNLLGKSSERRAKKDHEMIMAEFKQMKTIMESLAQIQQYIDMARREGTD